MTLLAQNWAFLMTDLRPFRLEFVLSLFSVSPWILDGETSFDIRPLAELGGDG
jgi:hypothetical protein